MQLFDHVVPFQVVSQLAIVVPRAHARNDCQLGGAVLVRRDALGLVHQQRAVALQAGAQECYWPLVGDQTS